MLQEHKMVRALIARLKKDGPRKTLDYVADRMIYSYGAILAVLAFADMVVRELIANLRVAISDYEFVDYRQEASRTPSTNWKSWQSKMHLTSTHFFGRRVIRQFMVKVSQKMHIGPRVLELGTGHEFFNRRLFGAGRCFYTSDYPKENCHDYEVDAENICFPDAFFDCIICSEVLEHVSQPYRAISEIHRVLKEGGLLILTVPFWVEIHDVYWNDNWRFTPSGLEILLGDRFEDIVIYTAHQYNIRRPLEILCTACKVSKMDLRAS
jgi:SAM-dependent methyltransferase